MEKGLFVEKGTRVDKSHIFVAPGHKFQTPLNNNASSFLTPYTMPMCATLLESAKDR